MEWRRVSPVYPVADVAASIEWYGRVLGFQPQLVNPSGSEIPVYAVLNRDGVSVHLLRLDEAPYGLSSPVQAQFWIATDLDELFRHVDSQRVSVLQRPGDRPRGHRDRGGGRPVDRVRIMRQTQSDRRSPIILMCT